MCIRDRNKTVVLGNKSRRQFNIIPAIKIFRYMPYWYLSLRKRNISFIQQLIILNRLIYLYQVLGYIDKNIEISNYSLFVSYYDSLIEDSFWAVSYTHLDVYKRQVLYHFFRV